MHQLRSFTAHLSLACLLVSACFSDPPGGGAADSTGTDTSVGTTAAASTDSRGSGDSEGRGSTSSVPTSSGEVTSDSTAESSDGGPPMCLPACPQAWLVCESFEDDWSTTDPPWATAGNGPDPTPDLELAACGSVSMLAAAAAGDPYSALQTSMAANAIDTAPHVIVSQVRIDPSCPREGGLRLVQLQLTRAQLFAYSVELWSFDDRSELWVTAGDGGTSSIGEAEPLSSELWHRLEIHVDFTGDPTASPGLGLRVDDHPLHPYDDAPALGQPAFAESPKLVLGPYPGPAPLAAACAVRYDEVLVAPPPM